jgi:hypothetical protein
MYIVTSQNSHNLLVLWDLANIPQEFTFCQRSDLQSDYKMHCPWSWHTKTKIRKFEGEINEQGYNSDALAYF